MWNETKNWIEIFFPQILFCLIFKLFPFSAHTEGARGTLRRTPQTFRRWPGSGSDGGRRRKTTAEPPAGGRKKTTSPRFLTPSFVFRPPPLVNPLVPNGAEIKNQPMYLWLTFTMLIWAGNGRFWHSLLWALGTNGLIIKLFILFLYFFILFNLCRTRCDFFVVLFMKAPVFLSMVKVEYQFIEASDSQVTDSVVGF